VRTTTWAWALALPLAAAVLAGCSTAVKWTPFRKQSDATWFYDTGSIRRLADRKVSVVILEDHLQPVLDRRSGQDYTSLRQTWQFDCNAPELSRQSTVEFSGHAGTGANLSDTSDTQRIALADPQSLRGGYHDEEPVRWEKIVPGSAESAMRETLCE